jgi:hypothetical protein
MVPRANLAVFVRKLMGARDAVLFSDNNSTDSKMKNYKERRMRAALSCLCLLLLCVPPAVGDDRDKLVGVWKIGSAIVEDIKTHEQKPLYGGNPHGYLILLATGRMMALLTSEERKAPQTDEERSIAYRSMVAYSGKYTVEGDTWITRPDVAWNPAFLVDQVRHFRVEGDKLYVETAPQMNPNFGKVVRVILVWEREK